MKYLFWIILLFVSLLIVIFSSVQKNNPEPTTLTPEMKKTIKTLLAQSSRYGAAAQQDLSPMIAVLHANYSAGYAWGLSDIATSEQIKAATGVDQLEFEEKIKDIQVKATKKAIAVCPQFAGEMDKYLAKISGNI